MTAVGAELQELSSRASFTVTDMATWCEVHKSAMREWMTRGVAPHPVKEKQVLEQLGLLKHYLDAGKLLPVPITVKQYERKAYINKARADALKTVLRSHTTGRRG